KAAGSLLALRAIASGTDLGARDVEDGLRLIDALESAGDAERAIALASAGWQRYPGDFWACFVCGRLHSESSPPHNDEMLRFYTAALAIRPRSAAVHNNLGLAFEQKGDHDGAIA